MIEAYFLLLWVIGPFILIVSGSIIFSNWCDVGKYTKVKGEAYYDIGAIGGGSFVFSDDYSCETNTIEYLKNLTKSQKIAYVIFYILLITIEITCGVVVYCFGTQPAFWGMLIAQLLIFIPTALGLTLHI